MGFAVPGALGIPDGTLPACCIDGRLLTNVVPPAKGMLAGALESGG